MYIRPEQELTLRDDDIVGFFDMETTSYSARTRKFLSMAESEGRVTCRGQGIPVSFVLTRDGSVHLIRTSTKTLKGKAGSLI